MNRVTLRIDKLIWVFSLTLLLHSPKNCICQTNPDYRFQITSTDSVRVTHSTGGFKFLGDLFTYEKVLELRENPSVEETIVSRPFQFIRDEEGYYYLVDLGSWNIVVYDPAGQYLTRFGRRGDGPGEFQSIQLQEMRADTLCVIDGVFNRVTRFTRDGQMVDIVTLVNAPRRLDEVHFCEDGRQVGIFRSNSRTEEYGVYSLQVISYRDLNNINILYQSELYPFTKYAGVIGTEGGGGIVVNAPRPYCPKPVATISPTRGILFTDGESAVLEWYSLDGCLTARNTSDIPPEQITRSEKREIKDRLLGIAQADRNPASRKAMEQRAENLDFPDRKALWQAALVDDRGYSWLVKPQYLRNSQQMTDTECTLVSPEGEFLGVTMLPTSVRNDYVLNTQIASGHLMVLIREEETGLLVPTVFRIHSAVDGLTYPN